MPDPSPPDRGGGEFEAEGSDRPGWIPGGLVDSDRRFDPIRLDDEAVMDTERNLLFGVVAFQNGAVDADGLAETCAAWNSESTLPLADMMVDRGLMTAEQKTQVEMAVERELASYGGDPHATLAATIDGRSLEAMGEVAGSEGVLRRSRRWGRAATWCWAASRRARPRRASATR
jgi:hypothetical protein